MPSASTRAELLLRLANQRGLTAAEGGRIARGAGELASGSRGMRRILQALVTVAPVDAILDAAARIPAADERAATLAALATRPTLSGAEGARIAGATRSLGQSNEIIEVLTTLLGRAPRSAIESAARRIPSDARREAFLRQLETASEPSGQ